MKRFIKKAIYTLLAYSGFYRLWHQFNKDSIVLLMIHGVMDTEEISDWIPTRPQISRAQLEAHVKLIAKYYEFISLSEAVAMLSGGKPFRSNCVVLTFDDGYRNNLTHAWPILKKYDIPAIIFPSVGHVARREPFWYDRIDFALQHASSMGLRECSFNDMRVTIDGSSRKNLAASIKRVVLTAKTIDGDDFEAMSIVESTISEIENFVGLSLKDIFETDDWTGVMSWNDLRRAREEGISIGSHTVDHSRLGLLGSEQAKEQMSESKRMLEEQLDQPCEYLCYPDGSYSHKVPSIAIECGYKAALTTDEGLNYVGDDLMQLRRFHLPHNGTAADGLAVASGLIYKINQLKQWMLS
jgi:peptidoglycan/xylan/chitin deacetylase (PgdA/CDA1 family)